MEIIDALVATLSLDDKEFQAAVKRTREARKRMRDDFEDSDKRIQTSSKRTEESFRSVRNEVGRLFLAFAGAKSLTDFVTGIISGDAATGRMAANLGIATEKLSAWESALKTVGGTASNADASLSSLQNMYENFALRGDASKAGELGQLGMTYADLKDPNSAMLKLAGASERMNRQKFVNLARSIGIDDNTITLLAKGRRGVEDVLETQRRLGVVTDRDAKAAERMQEKWANLTTAISGQARPEIEKLVDETSDWVEQTDAVGKSMTVLSGVLRGLQTIMQGLLSFIPDSTGHSQIGDAVSVMGLRAIAQYHHFRSWLAQKAGGDPAVAIREKQAEVDALQQIADITTRNLRRGAPGAAGGVTPDTRSTAEIRQSFPGYQPPHARSGGTTALSGNNPGGINDGPFARSQPGYTGPNGRYAAFATLEDGLNAQRALVRSYVRRGYDTPWSIAHRWAPRGDGANDPAAYAANVARTMGIGVNDHIGAAQIEAYVQAQARQENHRFGARAASARAGRRGGGGSSVQTGPITIYTAATDARGIARDLGRELGKRAIVVQANSGLQ